MQQEKFYNSLTALVDIVIIVTLLCSPAIVWGVWSWAL